jgi:hypothetical protein
MTDWQTAETCLSRTRAAHRSSPSGFAWHEFSQWLERAAPTATKKLPTPLILAASSEPAASKFDRLREQLHWACDHGVLAEAIAWLDACPLEKWETCDPASWGASSYPKCDDASDARDEKD